MPSFSMEADKVFSKFLFSRIGLFCNLLNSRTRDRLRQYRGADSSIMENKTKKFLADLRSGISFSDLMIKHNLDDARLNEILRKLNRRDLLALRSLWERDKLTDSQFMRAFSEIEDDLKSGK